jgi:hypothetical protein
VDVCKVQQALLGSPLYEKVVLKSDLGHNLVYTDDAQISRALEQHLELEMKFLFLLKAGINLKEDTFSFLVLCGKKVT